MLDCERLSVQMSREQGLRMTSRRKIERHKNKVGTARERSISPASAMSRHRQDVARSPILRIAN